MRGWPLICLALVLAARRAHAGRRDWTGSAACGSCHPAELAAWQATPHARTRDRFASRPEGRCLGCHATGEAPAGPVIAVEVGCEACHGPGAAHVAARSSPEVVPRPTGKPAPRPGALASVSPRAAVCAGCHVRPTRGTPFDPVAPVHPTPAGSRSP